jgi:ketosteroid isomerase-like protein
MRVCLLMMLLAATGCASVSPGGAGPTTAPTVPREADAATDSAGVHGAAERFLAAFDSLQWEPFRGALAEDATVFLPGAGPATRLEGRAAVEAYFRGFFAQVRANRAHAGQTAPPFLNIGPRVRDVRVQMLAPGAAVVSFHLGEGDAPARRSVTFRREGDGVWRVVHWHASAAPR